MHGGSSADLPAVASRRRWILLWQLFSQHRLVPACPFLIERFSSRSSGGGRPFIFRNHYHVYLYYIVCISYLITNQSNTSRKTQRLCCPFQGPPFQRQLKFACNSRNHGETGPKPAESVTAEGRSTIFRSPWRRMNMKTMWCK